MKTLVIINSEKGEMDFTNKEWILNLFSHFGIWYEIVNLSKIKLSQIEFKNISLIILVEENFLKSLEQLDVILKNVYNYGIGLVIWNSILEKFPLEFLKNLQIENFIRTESHTIRKIKENFITEDSITKEIEIKKQILTYTLSSKSWSPFLLNEKKQPVAYSTKFGKGKIVLFLIPSKIWQEEYLGYTKGLDNIFFKSLIWAAKKPFITKTIPNFVTARIDDVSGSGSPFKGNKEILKNFTYLEILNKYGFIPNLGLFIEDIVENEEKVIRKKYYENLAEFSPHAFTDPKNINEFPIYMRHNGQEFEDNVLIENFERVDKKFEKFGIKQAKTLNAHFGEVGKKALPFLKERGIKYLMNIIKVGKAFSDIKAHIGEIEPYRKTNYCYGYIPEDKYFFNVLSYPSIMGKEYIENADFLYKCTTFWNENNNVDVEKAIKRGIFQIKDAIENGFFGCLTTHEQRISYISISKWEEIVKGIYSMIKNLNIIFRSYDYISAYLENRNFYIIEKIEKNLGEIKIYLKGESQINQFLHLFDETKERIFSNLIEVPVFTNFCVLKINL